MSRSLRAWTKSCAFVSAVVPGAGNLGTDEVEGHLGHEHRVRTVSSLTPLTRVATAMTLMLALSPASALGKAGSPHSGSSVALTTRGALQAHIVTGSTSRNSETSDTNKLPALSQGSRAKLLALGNGYSDTDGSSVVRALQRRLNSLGYSPGPIDGRYGPLTEGAVIRFQAAHGLRMDGIAGPLTFAELASAKPIVRPGNGFVGGGSPVVRRLQQELAAAGDSPGPIDGRYGPRTEGAVKRFQSARHLRVDGIVGPQTLGDLQATPRPQVRQESQPVPSPWPPTTTHRGPGPSPTRSNRAPHRSRAGSSPTRSNRAPDLSRAGSSPTHHASRSGGFSWIIWVIVAACLLVMALAARLWLRHRPRRRARAGGLSAPESSSRKGQEVANGTLGGEVPDFAHPSVAYPERAAEVPPDSANGGKADQDEAAEAFSLGLRLAQNGDRAGAEDAFRRADQQGHLEAVFELGMLHMGEGDPAAAKDAFRHADQRGHPAAALHLGILLAQAGDHAAAKHAFRRADERGEPNAAFDLGALLVQDGDYAAAEEAFRRSDERGDAGAACNLGVLLEQRGDLDGARQAYQRADARGHGVGACNLGALLEQEGDLAAAREAYRRADDRGDSMGAYHLGLLLEQEGQRAAAKDAYRRADERGDPAGACKLGFLLRQDGDHAGALEAFERAREHGSTEVAETAHGAMLELAGNEDGER